ncbi:MAG: HAMP domain-containing protein [Alphaproteobacteria bacterium]|nr:HAMP domain-containing protein [Alphaproteobacteria bacterium]
MKIRARIALVAALVTAPQILGLLWWDGHSRHAAAEAVLGSMLERAVGEPGARAACLEDSGAWAAGLGAGPGAGPPPSEDRPPAEPPSPRRGQVMPPELHAYADEAADPGAPALTALRLGETTSLSPSAWSSEVWVGRRTGWGGPCELVVARGSTTPGFMGSVLPATPLWLGPLLLVVTVMWLAVAPPVRRIRALTRAVRGGATRVTLPGDDEIAELSRAFDAAARALEEEAARRARREEALREFVANTAHDVRIPITVLRGHLSALEQGHDPEALRRAAIEAHYLGALIDNLAAQARMDAPRRRDPVELGALTRRVEGRHQPIARRSGVSLACGVPEAGVPVEGDLTLIEQAVSNLVDNAIRHNRAGGHVALTLDLLGEGFVLRVLDDGPGVPAEELTRITERGYRSAEARSRGDRGSGLGLSIVAQVAAAHGWRFTLANAEEGGLEATLEGAAGAAPAGLSEDP